MTTRSGLRAISRWLRSYEPTHWTVTVDVGASLQKVIVAGYHAQRVTAPTNVEIEISSYEVEQSWLGCGYSLPYNGGGCDTNALIDAIEQHTGMNVHGFNGCYRLTNATLEDDLSLTSDCAYGDSHAIDP